jgi:protein phosphatase
VNEDQFLVAVLAPALRVRQTSLPQERWWFGDDRAHLFAVADGIGGGPGGEEASALAVSLVQQFLLKRLPRHLDSSCAAGPGILTVLGEAFLRADAAVCQRAARHAGLSGMGTTLTVAVSVGADLFVGHAGDSRAYLFRSGRLRLLTADHTLAGWLARHRLLRRGQDQSSAQRLLMNVIGGPNPGVEPELRHIHLQPDDVLLLCTDGLTDRIRDGDIATILAREPEPRRATARLVGRANRKGGTDNVTVVVARYALRKRSRA